MNVPPEKLGKYELRGTLGRGAMGIVYDGWDPLIDRRVAIKTVRLMDADDEETAEALARFKREAQAAGRLTHPNIVGVYDYGEVNDVAFIVMEFASGQSLKAVLDERKRLPPPEAVRVMEQVLAGLAYSHARGVVHRDIKPGNIIIVEGGQVKIADFGIARIESSSMTSVGTVMGTPAYMPPEQFLGEPVDARSDLYAAGVMAFQLLTGQRPYEGSMTTIMQKVLNTETPPLASARGGVPASFDAVVAKAMARAPADRFASADAFAASLRTALANADRPPPPGSDEDDDATVVVSKRPPAQTAAEPAPSVKAAEKPAPARATAPAAPAKKSSSMPLILGAAVVLLAAGGGGAYVVLRPAAPVAVIAPEHAPSLTAATQQPATETPPAHTTPPPAAPVDVASIGRAVTNAAAVASCSVLTTATDANGVRVGGYVAGAESETRARDAITKAAGSLPVTWQAQSLDPFWCRTMDTLRPMAASGMLSVTLASGDSPLHDFDKIEPNVAAPGFANWMLVDDFTLGGETAQKKPIGPVVVHFYPTAKAKARLHQADEMLKVRDPDWVVGPPFGTDLIVAVASSNPLFHAPRAAQENFNTYLAALGGALDDAAQRGDRVQVGIGLLKTEAKK